MSLWQLFKRWVMTRYYWWFAPYDTYGEENGGITYASSTEDAFNLVAPKKALQNPPPDLSHDEKHADGILLKAELVRAGFFEKTDYKPVSDTIVIPLVHNVDAITMKLYKNE